MLSYSRWLAAAALGLGTFAVVLVLGTLAVDAAGGPCDVPPAAAAYDSEEAAFLGLINIYRAQHGAPPLVANAALDRAAQWMATDLATHAYFSHTSSDGRSPTQRAQACGYPYGGGENIAGGTASAEQALAAWQSSPGHNNNMLYPGYRVIGIGRAFGGPYGVYWATGFGIYTQEPPPATYTPVPTATPTPTPAPVQHRYPLPQIARDN